MDIETSREDRPKGSAPGGGYRRKPFLTILDGAPLSKSRPRHAPSHGTRREAVVSAPRDPSPRHRQAIRFNPLSLIKKSRTKIQSYADEGAHTLAAGLKGRLIATAHTLAAIPKALTTLPAAIARKASSAIAALAASRRRVPRRGAAIEDTKAPLEAAPGESPRPAPQKRSLADTLASFRPAAMRAPRIILSAIIAVAALSVGTAAIIGATSFPVAPGSLLLPDEDSVQTALMAYLEPDSQAKDELPAGSLPPIPVSVSLRSYAVKSGDTLEKIAKRFGLRQDTIISSNNLQSSGAIRPGVQLRIPNMDGVSHRVRSGESLSSLAKTYAIDITRIVDANDLTSGRISIGQSLFIPNARLSSASLRNFYGERFVWPARGSISSPFGYRANPFTGLRTYHSAIDIVVSLGTKVKATSDGNVADTGYNSVFGNYVILKHANGYQSLYAHLSSISVKEGASVAQGAIIGLSGNTGQSTGPHLHFSIFKNGQALDPTKYVK